MRLLRTVLSSTLLLTALLTACGQPSLPGGSTPAPIAGTPSTPSQPSRSLGRVEVTFSGVGTQFYASSARSLTSGEVLRGQGLTLFAQGLQLRFNAKGTFDVGTPGNGTRYLYATYDVRNAGVDGTPYPSARSNLTFVAVDASAPETISGTAVRNLKRFDGSNADPALAAQILPLHGMMHSGGRPTVNPSQADFMAFTETEASSLGALPGVRSVLPYGYVVRHATNTATRTLAANPGSGQFDGQVTFAVKLPLQANAANDPYSFSLVFEVVEDSETRVTKTAEETRAAAEGRAQTLGATQVNADTVCKVRVAGSVNNPTTVLTGQGMGTSTPGSLDACFGTSGKVTTPISGGNSADLAYAMAVQPDGKIILAGSAAMGITGNDFALVRYNADGSLDTSFGSGGKVTTAIASSNGADVPNAMSVLADGKILVAGYSSSDTTGLDFALARYNADGSLDASFGSGGKVTTSLASGSGTNTDIAFDISVQADGKIVVAGYTYRAATGNDIALVRYNADGSLDTSFGSGGKVITAVASGTPSDIAYAISLQGDGKIIVAGVTYTAATGDDIVLARYNVDGSLDMSFDADGKVITAIASGTNTDLANDVMVQADGKILATGYADMGSATGQDAALVRYNADGSLDTSFDTDGKVTTALGGGVGLDEARAVSMQADGKIVVAGYAGMGGATGQDAALVRYNASGSLDTSFGTGGKVTTAFASGTGSDRARALLIQADGKIVIAGNASMGSTTGTDFVLARYNP